MGSLDYIKHDKRFNKKAFLYETTNMVNGKTYIGVRTYQFRTEDDHYLGSGKLILKAIEKYGKESFTRRTLVISTAEYCYNMERKLVTEEFVKSRDNYNIAVGGLGGYRGDEVNDQMIATQRQQWLDQPEEFKQERKEFLASILVGISPASGKKTHKWVGYWSTHKGVFLTSRAAGASLGEDSKSLTLKCHDCDRVAQKSRIHPNINKSMGITYRDLGYSFIPAEDIIPTLTVED